MDRGLNRFLKAQESDYAIALSEIRSGRKKSHWMWYIFPQISGLGFSETAKYYAIRDIDEAREFLSHPVLGKRLKEISNELLKPEQTNAKLIFGSPDDLKLRSCMTLFAQIETGEGNIFEKVIDKFFNGIADDKTLALLKQ
jgi:uncharacterized protein (DUF1810 family)